MTLKQHPFGLSTTGYEKISLTIAATDSGPNTEMEIAHIEIPTRISKNLMSRDTNFGRHFLQVSRKVDSNYYKAGNMYVFLQGPPPFQEQKIGPSIYCFYSTSCLFAL